MFRNNYTNTQPKNTKHLYAMTKYMETELLRVPSLLVSLFRLLFKQRNIFSIHYK